MRRMDARQRKADTGQKQPRKKMPVSRPPIIPSAFDVYFKVSGVQSFKQFRRHRDSPFDHRSNRIVHHLVLTMAKIEDRDDDYYRQTKGEDKWGHYGRQG